MVAHDGMRTWRILAWIAVVTVTATAWLPAEETAPQGARQEKSPEEQRHAAYVRSMQGLAARLKVVRVVDGSESACQLVEESVLNWNDSARHPNLIVPGTTWIWHEQGRPVFIGEIYGRKDSIGSWFLFACNLSPDPLRCTDGRISTAMTKTYYDPQEIADAPAVATTKSARTFQMRQLVARFDAHQFWDDRFELRLLPKPIYRYGKEKDRIIDGAVFALVHGTNPEVIVLIEAHAADDGSERWKVGFGSLAGARCVVQLDGKEYWTCPKHNGDPADPRQGFMTDAPVAEGGRPEDTDASAHQEIRPSR